MGGFLLCSVTDGKEKRRKIFFPEGRGLVNGWALLAKKLKELRINGKTKANQRNLGVKGKSEEKEEELTEDGYEKGGGGVLFFRDFLLLML